MNLIRKIENNLLLAGQQNNICSFRLYNYTIISCQFNKTINNKNSIFDINFRIDSRTAASHPTEYAKIICSKLVDFYNNLNKPDLPPIKISQQIEKEISIEKDFIQ